MRAMDMHEIIKRAGGPTKLAKVVSRHHATVLGWTRVPAEHVRAVSRATDLPPHELRPDLWDPLPAASGDDACR